MTRTIVRPHDGSVQGDYRQPARLSSASDIDGPNSLTFAPLSNVATANGGHVTLQSDGDFVFTPKAGDSNASDSFNFTVTDGNSPTAGTVTKTATINFNGPHIWYVDAGAAAGGDGSSEHPFNSLAPLNGTANDGTTGGDVDTSGDIIYLENGTYSSGITLENNEKLISRSQGLVVSDGAGGAGTVTLDPASGSNAVINGAVVLGSNNTISGITFGDTGSGTALSGTNFGTLNIDHSAVNTDNNGMILDNGAFGAGAAFTSFTSGGLTDVSLTTVGGSIDLGTGTMNGLFAVSGGSVSTTYSGNLSQANNAAMVSVSGGHTGTMTFQTGTLTATNGTGLQFDNADGTYNFNGTNTLSNTVGGATANAGIDIINGSNGTFNFRHAADNINNTTITNPTGVAFNVSGGTGSIDFNGTISKTSNGQAISVVNHTGGTVSFDGSVSSTSLSDGINLTGNTSANINFTGALTLDTSSSGTTAFNASGGGTVTATASGSTINSGAGTALNISNTTIGASGVNFKSISSNGAASGIVLNTTGGSGGLTVTGDGTNATQGGNGSGGAIQNTTGVAVSLTSTKNVNLNYLNITNPGTDGINAQSIDGFVYNRGTISDSSGAAGDAGIQFGDFSTGTAVNGIINITNSLVGPAAGSAPNDNVAVGISGGTSTWTVSGNKFQNNNNADLNVEVRNTTNATMNVANNTFAGNATTSAEGIHMQPAGAGTTATLNATIQNNNFSNNNISIDVNDDISAHTTYKILNNSIVNDIRNDKPGAGAQTSSHAINAFMATTSTSSALMDLRIDGNTIGSATIAGSGSSIGNGMRINFNGNGVGHVAIDNNVIREAPDGRGIEVIGRNGTGQLDLTVKNNDVNQLNTTFDPGTSDHPLAAILVQSNTLPTAGYTIRADVTGNTVPATSNAEDLLTTYIALVESGASNLQLVDTPPASANATAQLQSTNTGSASGNAGVSLIPGPINLPPLLAATGGVQASSPTPGETHISQAQLDSVVAAAIAQWAHAGASAAQLAMLAAVTFSVADLSGATIGEQGPGAHITIDADAAGHGWFVDATPSESSEFIYTANAGETDLFADPSSPAAGHLDLLTTVAHELGHALGLPDIISDGNASDLMDSSLVDGERRLPDAVDVALTKIGETVAYTGAAMLAEATLPLSAQAAQGTPVIVGTAGNDSIDAAHGGNILFGGAGADAFVFGPDISVSAKAPPPVTHVADYSAAEGDTFDFSALKAASYAWKGDDASLVRAVEDASGTFANLLIRAPDQHGSWINLAQIDGAHAGDAVNVLLDSHYSVHLAHIQVGTLI